MELRRRVEAKDTVEQKRKWEEQKIAMEAEKIRRAKEKEEAHKQAVLEKIRREKGEKQGTIIAPAIVPASNSQRDITECTVQIRTAAGNLLWKGSPDAPLSEVARFVAEQKGMAAGKVAFSTPHPRQVYAGEQLDTTSLRGAGMVPRGVLVLEK